jgi:hypothetical protein
VRALVGAEGGCSETSLRPCDRSQGHGRIRWPLSRCAAACRRTTAGLDPPSNL